MALNESGVALHLSSQLRAEIPAAACIPDGLAGLAVISDAYVQQEPDLADHTSWRTLFLGVGVDWFPVVHLTKDDGCGRGGGGTGDAGEWGSTALSALLADLVCDCDVGRLNLLAAALAERWPALLGT